MDFEYGIIGGGPAGYTTGMMIAKQGHSVILFEKNELGGTCLNKGCIPTKSLIHSSEIYNQIVNSSNIGVDLTINNFDFAKIAEKRDITVSKIRKNLELAVKNSGVNVVYAEAKIKDKNTILTDKNVYKVNNIIVATGSKPRELEGLEFDGDFILSSDDVLKLEKLPKSVLIVGSGAIGIEWARIFSNFGVEVSIVEMASHLIPNADIEISKRIERIFKQKKIRFFTENCIEKIENMTVILKTGEMLSPDFILSAVGRIPINPDVEGVITIGDACGEIQLAHYAIQQAKELVFGVKCNKNLIPAVIYGEPEIAWIGMREQDCDETYTKITMPISALGKSLCDDSTDGFIKIITKEKKIAGAHIVSKEASALIHQILIAMQNDISTDDLKEICYAHPTYSEGIFETLIRM